jgi:hypothetical protein
VKLQLFDALTARCSIDQRPSQAVVLHSVANLEPHASDLVSSPLLLDRPEKRVDLVLRSDLDDLEEDRLSYVAECLRGRTERQESVLTFTVGEREGGRGEGEADNVLDELEWEFAEHVTSELFVRSACLLS